MQCEIRQRVSCHRRAVAGARHGRKRSSAASRSTRAVSRCAPSNAPISPHGSRSGTDLAPRAIAPARRASPTGRRHRRAAGGARRLTRHFLLRQRPRAARALPPRAVRVRRAGKRGYIYLPGRPKKVTGSTCGTCFAVSKAAGSARRRNGSALDGRQPLTLPPSVPAAHAARRHRVERCAVLRQHADVVVAVQRRQNARSFAYPPA